jgi:phosphopantothenoylcysteine decarboxylase/phosphopantothenate--cysteine ligase
VIAPATADLMARLVHGEAPDALTAVALACRAPWIVCPAMDREMWRQPATRANVAVLRSRGAVVVGPATGELASGLSGPGRLAELPQITAAIERAVERRASLAGVHVLVGAGRTEEPLDPVRVLTNRSSGRMGLAVAEAARDRGARITLVAGAMDVEPAQGMTVIRVGTAAEMERAMLEQVRRAEVVIMAAAVADYRPARSSKTKLKSGAPLTLRLVSNPDILAGMSARRRSGQVLVGFALETRDGLRNARAKLAAKGLDLIVLNSPREGLGGDTNRVTLVERTRRRALPRLSKREVAEAILDRIADLRGGAKPRRAHVRAARPRRARRSGAAGGKR